MIRYTVAREDNIYKCFPDLAQCGDGTLVLAYRESLEHAPYPFSRIAIQRSFDEGCCWTRKEYVAVADSSKEGRWNNPRLLCTGGQNLLLLCDWFPLGVGEGDPRSEIHLWRSCNGGKSWGAGQDTGILGHICPSIARLRDGTLIIAGTQNCNLPPRDVDVRANVFRSGDGGQTWQGPFFVAGDPALCLCEGTVVELPDGTLVAYMREDKRQEYAYKAVSSDGGRTWHGPFRTQLYRCSGRPKAGLLQNGDVAVTYGCGINPRNLMLYVESACVAARAGDTLCDSHASRIGMIGKSVHFAIDHDRSITMDGAYSGWVNLAGGDIYIVQYILDDAPMAQIRGYRVSRGDYKLGNPHLPVALLSREGKNHIDVEN